VSKDAAVRLNEGDLVSREGVCLSPMGERTHRLRGETGTKAPALEASPPTSRARMTAPSTARCRARSRPVVILCWSPKPKHRRKRGLCPEGAPACSPGSERRRRGDPGLRIQNTSEPRQGRRQKLRARVLPLPSPLPGLGNVCALYPGLKPGSTCRCPSGAQLARRRYVQEVAPEEPS